MRILRRRIDSRDKKRSKATDWSNEPLKEVYLISSYLCMLTAEHYSDQPQGP